MRKTFMTFPVSPDCHAFYGGLVMPAQAGIHNLDLDPRFRGGRLRSAQRSDGAGPHMAQPGQARTSEGLAFQILRFAQSLRIYR